MIVPSGVMMKESAGWKEMAKMLVYNYLHAMSAPTGSVANAMMKILLISVTCVTRSTVRVASLPSAVITVKRKHVTRVCQWSIVLVASPITARGVCQWRHVPSVIEPDVLIVFRIIGEHKLISQMCT